MGYALQKSDSKASRGRPNKALRLSNRRAENLIAYPSSASREFLERSTAQTPKKAEISADALKEGGKFGAQPYVETAANSEITASSFKPWLGSVPRKQVRVALIGCLCTGALVGHQWSVMTSQPQLFGQSVMAVMPSVVELESQNLIEPTGLIPLSGVTAGDVSPLALDAGVNDDKQQYSEKEREYLAEIDWLTTQSSSLQFDVDVLNQETFDQQVELLELELQVVALRSKSEQPTETRIIYNFVDVPIGEAVDKQYDDADYVDAADASEPVDIDNEELFADWELESEDDDDPDAAVYDPTTGNYIYPDRADEDDE